MGRPQLVYEDACGFCTWATAFAVRYGPFEPVGFAEVTPELRERLPDDYESCAHLVTDDETYSCGRAVEVALTRIFPVLALVVPVLRPLPGYATARERLYHAVAARRHRLSAVVSADPPVRA